MPKPPKSSTVNQYPKLTEAHTSLRETVAQILQYLNDVEDSIKLNNLADNSLLVSKGELIRKMIQGVYRGYNLEA